MVQLNLGERFGMCAPDSSLSLASKQDQSKVEGDACATRIGRYYETSSSWGQIYQSDVLDLNMEMGRYWQF